MKFVFEGFTWSKVLLVLIKMCCSLAKSATRDTKHDQLQNTISCYLWAVWDAALLNRFLYSSRR